MRGFGSDNHAPVHPALFNALQKANQDHSPSYGTDPWSQRTKQLFKEHFGPSCEAHFVFNGTGANVTALKTICRSYEGTLCTDISHLWVDECGAPELSAGKLIPIPHVDGKLTVENLNLFDIRKGDQHFVQNKCVSITQPTELGTCYSLVEIKNLCDWAHQRNYIVHMDGARIANAVVELQTTFKQMTTDLGVDVISFGGTKNGFLFGEAVLFLRPVVDSKNYKYIRKQLCQLPSKTRYIACQFEEYLKDDLWKNIAAHACKHAEILHGHLEKFPQIQITHKRQSNAVFAILPRTWVKALREKYFFYVWNEHSFECRLMTSWDTTEEEINGLISELKILSESL